MSVEIVTMLDCASNYGIYDVLGSKGRWYRVHLNGSEGPAHCTCPAFKYSGEQQSCKHIERIRKEACLYNPQWRVAKASPAIRPIAYEHDLDLACGSCVCGEPLTPVRRAV